MSAERETRSAESAQRHNRKKTLVCFALEEEAKGLAWKVWGMWGQVLITGIGKNNAERSVRNFLVNHSPKRVFTCGFAGGLDPALVIGDVVFSTDDLALREKLTAAGAKPAKFFCAPRMVTTIAEKAELRRTAGADAVEMESEVIHAVCRERGIPCATVRGISDTANEDLPLDFNQLVKPDMNLDYGKLAWAIVKSPGKIGALLRLQKQTRLAAERIAAVVAQAIGPCPGTSPAQRGAQRQDVP